MKRIETYYNVHKNKKIKCLFVLKRGEFKKLKQFAGCLGGGIYALNNIGSKYYWFDGMTGGGNWYRGGFFPFPICAFPNDFLDIETGEVWKFIKEME